MGGGQDELHLGTAEADRVRAPGELPGRLVQRRRQHDLPDQAGRLNSGGVVDERQSLVVTVVPDGHVGGHQAPFRAELGDQEPEGGDVPPDFLDSDDVELRHHGGDEGDRSPVTLRSAPRAGVPGRRQTAEGPKVPGRQQQVVRCLGRHLSGYRPSESGDLRPHLGGHVSHAANPSTRKRRGDVSES